MDLGKNASRRFRGEQFQRIACVAHFGARHFVAKKQADRVDHRAGKLLHAVDGLLQEQAGGIVVAVGDEDEHLLGTLGVGGQFVGRGHHGIVKRGAAAGIDVRKPIAQLVNIGRKVADR